MTSALCSVIPGKDRKKCLNLKKHFFIRIPSVFFLTDIFLNGVQK